MYQKLTLIGNVGEQPELRYTDTGIAVTSFSLATNKKWKDQNGTEHERTRWFRVTCWRRQAEVVSQFVKKGSLIMVEADDITASAYKANDGEPRASMEVQAREVKFLQLDKPTRQNNDFVAPPSAAGDGDASEDIPF